MIEIHKKEQALLHLLLVKDENSWKELFDRYGGNLTTVCSRYIKSKDDVRDVLQESFIKVFNSIHLFEYRGEGSLKAWMIRITVNESLKHLKKNSGSDLISNMETLPDVYEDQEDIKINELSHTTIIDILNELPLGYKTVFNLYVFERKSHYEIGCLLGIAENSSASQFHRAKKMIAAKIREIQKNIIT